MSSLQVLCPNGRRVNVKVTPNTPLLSVLVDACQKHGLDPRQHALKHQRRTLDGSQMFRYSGLPNNAKLEVVASSHNNTKEQSVKVAVQLPSSSRLQGVFTSTTSIWDLMCSLHGNDQWIVGEPVVVYMRREVCGENTLKATTLRDLGVDRGSVVLRLNHRQQQQQQEQEEGRNQLLVNIPMDTSECTDISSSAEKVNSSEDMITEQPDSHDKVVSDLTSSHDTSTNVPVVHDTALVTAGSHDLTTISSHIISCDPLISGSHDTTTKDLVTTDSHDPTNTSSHDPATSGSQTVKSSHDLISASSNSRRDEGSCDHQVVVFNMANHSADTMATVELPDSFFDVTVDDCAAMQRDLHQQVKRLTDAPLTTSSLREATLHERYSQYNKATIRIQFPDHWVLQGSFNPYGSLKELVEFVQKHLADPTVKFYLYTTPPKRIINNTKLTLVQAGLVPASIVYFGLHDSQEGGQFLKTSLLEQAVSPLQADIIAMTTRDKHNNQSPTEATSDYIPTTHTVNTMDDTTNYSLAQNQDTFTRGKTSGKAVPKWFKLLAARNYDGVTS